MFENILEEVRYLRILSLLHTFFLNEHKIET
jgi:hypothetical protein